MRRFQRECPQARESDIASLLAVDLDGSFEKLVLAYQDRLYAFALRLSGNRQDAEEVAQDAFLRAYRALRGYPEAQVRDLALRPWLYQIALNVFRNRGRRKRPASISLERDGDGGTLEVEDDERERPEAIAEEAERQATLGALVVALPERYRTAVILRHVEGLTYREIAEVLKQPTGTVKANVHRGVELLRASMTSSVRGRSEYDG